MPSGLHSFRALALVPTLQQLPPCSHRPFPFLLSRQTDPLPQKLPFIMRRSLSQRLAEDYLAQKRIRVITKDHRHRFKRQPLKIGHGPTKGKVGFGLSHAFFYSPEGVERFRAE